MELEGIFATCESWTRTDVPVSAWLWYWFAVTTFNQNIGLASDSWFLKQTDQLEETIDMKRRIRKCSAWSTLWSHSELGWKSIWNRFCQNIFPVNLIFHPTCHQEYADYSAIHGCPRPVHESLLVFSPVQCLSGYKIETAVIDEDISMMA